MRARLQAVVWLQLEVCRTMRDVPYCERFVLAGAKREPNKQSLWEQTVSFMPFQKECCWRLSSTILVFVERLYSIAPRIPPG